MNAQQKNEYVLNIKTYDKKGKFKSLETYVLIPLEDGRTYWLHSSLCGAPPQKLRALGEFLSLEEIVDEIDELALGSLILVDALHKSVSDYKGCPEVGYAFRVH